MLRGCWAAANSPCCIYPSYRQFLPTPCFVHRADAKPPAFRDVTPVPSFLDTVVSRTAVKSPCSFEHGLRLHGKNSSCCTSGLYLRTRRVRCPNTLFIFLKFFVFYKHWLTQLKSYNNVSRAPFGSKGNSRARLQSGLCRMSICIIWPPCRQKACGYV